MMTSNAEKNQEAGCQGDNLLASPYEESLLSNGENFHGYVVERFLSKGATGDVYLVRHAVLDTLFALKVLHPDIAEDNPEYVKRFLREAKLATRIRHPNLVAVYDCGFSDEKQLYFLVMDYVNGGDLRQAIAFTGKFPPDQAVGIILQVASALEAAQRFNMVHRDIKPENIMLQPDGTAKLVDLGVAKATDIDNSLQTATDRIFGTPAYISPEQSLCAADVDQRADIYSLGIILFEMLAGKTPYAGKNPADIITLVLSDKAIPDIRDYNADIAPELASIIARMCAKNRDRRIPSASALIGEFEKIGYALHSSGTAPHATYAPTAQQIDRDTVGSILSKLPKAPNTVKTLSFDTDDKEIRRFVTKMKLKRLSRRIAFAVIAAVVIGIIFLLICK